VNIMLYLTTNFLFPILLGMAFGFVVQRGFFCLNSGTADFLTGKESSKFKAFLLAIAIQLVLFAILFILIPPWTPRSDFYPVRALLGGLIFGFSMFYAGGCASGVWFKIGEGKLGALIAMGSLMAGLVLTPKLVSSPLLHFLKAGWNQYGNLYMLTDYAPILAVAVGTGLFWYLIRTPNSYPKSANVGWKTTGSLLALISLLSWMSSQIAGRAYGMGIIGGTADLYQSIVTQSLPRIPWEMFFVLGIPLGSFISAQKDRKFKILTPPLQKIYRPIFGGLGMGIGGALAGGCTVGYGLVGIPVFSFAGITCFGAIILGVHLRILLQKRFV
jgi:uncharacterized protein